jgi:hypothetical protein
MRRAGELVRYASLLPHAADKVGFNVFFEFHAAQLAIQKSVAQPLSFALEFVQQCQPKESTVKLELTEAEVKDIVLRHIREVFPAQWSSVEFDCAYGYFKKAVIETKEATDDRA